MTFLISKPRRYRLKNPVTGEMKLVHYRDLPRLTRYGWVKVSLDEWTRYQLAMLTASSTRTYENCQ